jgi:hypothetical protein
VSAPTDDWTDPDWTPALLPSSVLVLTFEFWCACGLPEEEHCCELHCPAQAAVGCHRPHYEDTLQLPRWCPN